ncbi:MAG: hypothetical protein NXH86_02475 [Flavobacteriaceae bacterium]|jgi:hypothetical protein|uniref:hypothetical protein n=1 Tax=Flagellimonas sp. SN16 TaxID=3415142 RepID=UPI000E222778|nr:hypothetical protein [Flavobacteriaceae bacterium]
MENNDTKSIRNPFEEIGKLWGIFSIICLICGIVLLLLTKGDFQSFREHVSSQDGSQIIPFGQFILKLFTGSLLLGIGVKYLRVALSVVFKFDPDKKLTESLAKDLNSSKKSTYAYNKGSLFKLLQEKDLELIKPTTLIENITTRVFVGLKKIPPRYFIVSQNFLNALISSFSPFLILFVALFLDYLEIIDVFYGSRFEWLLLLVSISVVFSWSPFSPITNESKKSIIAIILSVCSIGTFLILKTSSFNYELPEIPKSVFLVTLIFVLLSAGIFFAFFFLLKRRVYIEDTNDEISVSKTDVDLGVHPDEIRRIISNRLAELGSSSIVNRIYDDYYHSGNGKFSMALMQETQPIPKATLNDTVLNKSAKNLSKIGFAGAIVGLIALVAFVSGAKTFIGLLLSTVTTLGIINFGLKLISLSTLFLSEFAFESILISVDGNGEYKSSRITAGRGLNDSVESRNEVTKSSISLQFVSSSILSVSFIRLGKADPFDHSPRYVVSLDKNESSNTYLINSFNKYLSEKSQIIGVSGRDVEKIKNLNSLTNPIGLNGTTEPTNKSLLEENTNETESE